MEYAKHGLKNARPGANPSATSRKNKLQRCSICGGLGHKSRTCEVAAYKMDEGAETLSNLMAVDDDKDAKTVLAAYGLLTLAAAQPEPSAEHSSQPQRPYQPRSPQRTQTMVIAPHNMEPHSMLNWQPLSPRLLAT